MPGRAFFHYKGGFRQVVLAGNLLHQGIVQQGEIKLGDTLATEVTAAVREATALNHSATHLLHAALRQVLGDHVAQKGSLVDAQRLRFDFSHGEAVTPAQLKQIETLVNDEVRRNTAVETRVTDMDTAVAAGAMALSSVSVLTNALRLRRIAPALREDRDITAPRISAKTQPAE